MTDSPMKMEYLKEVMFAKKSDVESVREYSESWQRLIITIVGAAIAGLLFKSWPINNIIVVFSGITLFCELIVKLKKLKIEEKLHESIRSKVNEMYLNALYDTDDSEVQNEKLLDEIAEIKKKQYKKLTKFDKYGNIRTLCFTFLFLSIFWEFIIIEVFKIIKENFNTLNFHGNLFLFQIIVIILIISIYSINTYNKNKKKKNTQV